jgi:hypothetical protein
MSGKGSRPRPLSVDRKTFEKNWSKIFDKKSEKSSKKTRDCKKQDIYKIMRD